MNKTVEMLNRAFKADKDAMFLLTINRVQCNLELATDPDIQAEHNRTTGTLSVGALGLINGVLAANGLPLVAAMFEDTGEGYSKMIGFCEYEANP